MKSSVGSNWLVMFLAGVVILRAVGPLLAMIGGAFWALTGDLSPACYLLFGGMTLASVPVTVSTSSVPSNPKRYTGRRRGTADSDPRCTCETRAPSDSTHHHGHCALALARSAGDDLDRLTREYRDGSLGTLDYLLAIDKLEPDVSNARWRSPKTRSKVLEDPSKGIARIWQQEPATDAVKASLRALMVSKQSAKGNAGRTVILEPCSDCEMVISVDGEYSQTVCSGRCRRSA